MGEEKRFYFRILKCIIRLNSKKENNLSRQFANKLKKNIPAPDYTFGISTREI